MAQALQVQFLQAGIIDINGDPLVDGQVETKETDGVTDKVTWLDAEKVTPATNPVILDSRGTARIFVDGSITFIIKNPGGGVLDTFNDNFFNPNDPDALGVVKATDFGTDLNDTTISLAIASIGGTDRTLYITPGAWAIDNDLVIPSNITFRIERGALLTVAAIKTLTISGDLDAPYDQVFDGAGTVIIGTNTVNQYDVWKTGTQGKITRLDLAGDLRGFFSVPIAHPIVNLSTTPVIVGGVSTATVVTDSGVGFPLWDQSSLSGKVFIKINFADERGGAGNSGRDIIIQLTGIGGAGLFFQSKGLNASISGTDGSSTYIIDPEDVSHTTPFDFSSRPLAGISSSGAAGAEWEMRGETVSGPLTIERITHAEFIRIY